MIKERIIQAILFKEGGINYFTRLMLIDTVSKVKDLLYSFCQISDNMK